MKNFFLSILILNGIFKANAIEYYGTVTLNQLTVEITLNDESQEATIKMTGPSSEWFAIGLGSQVMNGTYSIFANEGIGGGISERILGHWNMGTTLIQEAIIDNYTSSGSSSTYIIKRPLNSGNGGYDFTTQSGEIDVILAIGPNQTQGSYHAGNRIATKIILQELNPTASNSNTQEKFFKIYPNPVVNNLNLIWSEVAPLTIIEILSLDGKLIISETASQEKQKTINISTLTSGTYLIRVNNSEWNGVLNFTKK